MEKLRVEVVVGYMLKVLKNGYSINKFKPEFAAIRHGDYDEFIKLVKGETPQLVYSNGNIRTENLTQQNTCDFVGLILAGPSLNKFYEQCKLAYVNIIDKDVTDDIFEKLVNFELSLRMHGNNHKLLNHKENLIYVINKVGKFKNLTNDEIVSLQQGRDFLNMIKCHNKKYNTYNDGVVAFNAAYDILKKYNITICK